MAGQGAGRHWLEAIAADPIAPRVGGQDARSETQPTYGAVLDFGALSVFPLLQRMLAEGNGLPVCE
jgi:hypothetical protein